MKTTVFLILLLFPLLSFAQKTKVVGTVLDEVTGDPMPFVSVRFQDSKIGVFTDTSGKYMLDTYYATDTLVFSFSGYIKVKKGVERDVSQTIDVSLPVLTTDYEEVVVQAPDEFPSTILHKKVIAHKPINNKEKLDSYEYEVYNKVQLDINNITEKFTDRKMVQRLDIILDYLDSVDNGKNFLPVILSESVSDYYYRKSPKKRKEIMKASRISGVDNLELNQFLGDMYLNMNVYDNSLFIFNKSFISPVADYARSFYRFYLEDSSFIDNNWCYKLTFTPKRTGDMTFEGEMWIHDTTYAVKRFSANISPWTNINYVQDLYIEHEFAQVAPEVWMLTSEKMIADLKLSKKSNLYGMFGRRHSTRTNYVINAEHPADFYQSNSTVTVLDSANMRSDEYWAKIRHEPLSAQEAGIDEMIDSLQNIPFFKRLEKTLYLITTGYLPAGKFEIGDAFSLFSYNPIEKFRLGLALRTSNDFSEVIEIGGRIAYGFGDQKFKYGVLSRINLSKKKRTMLSLYYNFDLEQIGQAPSAAAIGSTFGSLLRTGPLDKLTFVEKIGLNIERDIAKDVILFGGIEWKEFSTLDGSVANFLKPNLISGGNDTISKIQTTEIVLRYRWAKNEEFISGAFDRTSIRSKFPIISLQGIFGIKGILGADYNYQKLELMVEHTAQLGLLGRLKYSVTGGLVFGTMAYPFLKVHAGNQSFWLQDNAFNKMNFFEFVSDQYVEGKLENHWDGFFFDRVPLLKRAKLRLVTTAKAAWGMVSDRHQTEMLIPSFTKQFGAIPYVEVAMGIENILTLGRVDVFWRLTHLGQDANGNNIKVTDLAAFGIRTKYVLNF